MYVFYSDQYFEYPQISTKTFVEQFFVDIHLNMFKIYTSGKIEVNLKCAQHIKEGCSHSEFLIDVSSQTGLAANTHS